MIKLQNLPQRLLVGLSGGADSVALLLLLMDAGKQITAVHVNHGLRGDASDGDEVFVRALCEKHQVPLLTYRADPPETPAKTGPGKRGTGFSGKRCKHPAQKRWCWPITGTTRQKRCCCICCGVRG